MTLSERRIIPLMGENPENPENPGIPRGLLQTGYTVPAANSGTGVLHGRIQIATKQARVWLNNRNAAMVPQIGSDHEY